MPLHKNETNQAYAIGLDIGVNIGWAVLSLDEKGEPCKIHKLGVYAFDKSEKPKTGETLNAVRRKMRSARRIRNRKVLRIKDIKSIIQKHGVADELSLINACNDPEMNPYKLRVEALDRPLTSDEFARVLYHIAQRRGFRSNRLRGTSKEDGKVISAVQGNVDLLAEKNYRTAGEMFYKDEKFRERKRNSSGDYKGVVSRKLVEEEIEKIFEAQRRLGNALATVELETEYTTRLMMQRSFDMGPGKGSPRFGNQIEKMVGNCTFFEDEPRAASATYSNEYRNLLQNINHIRIFTKGCSRPLTDEERMAIVDFAFSHNEVSYEQLRKLLNLSPEETFNISYTNESVENAEKKKKIKSLSGYQSIKAAIVDRTDKDFFKTVTDEEIDTIATVLTLYKTDDNIRCELKARGIRNELVEIAQYYPTFDKFARISLKACKMIIPYLEQGLTYDKACDKAGLSFNSRSEHSRSHFISITEEELSSITSPVAKRAICKTFKLINAIIRDMGCSPTYINIETTREISSSKSKKKEIESKQKANRDRNDAAAAAIKDTFKKEKVTAEDILRYKLWKEQDEICIYSGKKIPAQLIFTNKCEVDHIIPYSRCFDDGFINKVLVFAEENQKKGPRLPLDYLTGEKLSAFRVNVERLYAKDGIAKYRRLLKESITDEDVEGFSKKNLQDTSLISVFVKDYLTDNLEFAPSSRKIKVNAVSGRATAMLRRCWGLTKNRDLDDKHHAMDAVVIGCVTPKLIKRVSDFNRYREERSQEDGEKNSQFTIRDGYAFSKDTGEVVGVFPEPWNSFGLDLSARLSDNPVDMLKAYNFPQYNGDYSDVKPITVSRVVRRTATGCLHDATIMSSKYIDEGYSVKRIPLIKLKLDSNGEIKDYFKPETDRLLYEALKQRIVDFDGKADKAFAEPFYKPKADGTKGPIVKRVKIKQTTNSYVELDAQGGIANKDNMIRLDVYRREQGGYDAVPVYAFDLTAEGKDIILKRVTSKRLNPDDFQFCLQKGDLFGYISKGETSESLAYYKGFDIESSRIEYHETNCKKSKSNSILRISIKSAVQLKKYTIDPLGNVYEVKKEKRRV